MNFAAEGGRKRALRQQAVGPLVTLGQEQFTDASTWDMISNFTSSAAAFEVHGYGGAPQSVSPLLP